MADPDRDILDLIESGRKIEAIKLAREHLGLGLAEAKDFVEGLAVDAKAGGPGAGAGGAMASARRGHDSPVTVVATQSRGHGTPPSEADLFDDQLDNLLRAKKKIDAVRLYRQRAGGQLKDAKDAIEARAVALGLQSRPSKCFIATAACGGGEQADVMTLRRFRNRVLRQSRAGRAFIAVYERLSPPLAWVVGRSEVLAACVRVAVGLAVRAVASRPR